MPFPQDSMNERNHAIAVPNPISENLGCDVGNSLWFTSVLASEEQKDLGHQGRATFPQGQYN